MKKKVAVLGSTGSIGKSTLAVLQEQQEFVEICALTAHSQKEALEAVCAQTGCTHSLLTAQASPAQIEAFLEEAEPDICVNGVAGSAGLIFSLAALKAGSDLALANKESLVMAGGHIRSLAAKYGRRILPVDSEHSAIFCLRERFGPECIDSVILTASGGPFRTLSSQELKSVQLEDALRHPTWQMGAKITVDSASLANKGLEVIEACAFFDLHPSQVQVAVHPQSLVHSLIRTRDGVLYAQISKPDMRHPILTALSWPDTVTNSLPPLDLSAGVSLDFFPPRTRDFPLLSLAYRAAEAGGSYPIAYNAANEEAAAAFIQKRIGFCDMALITESVMQSDWSAQPDSIEAVFETDTRARAQARLILKEIP